MLEASGTHPDVGAVEVREDDQDEPGERVLVPF